MDARSLRVLEYSKILQQLARHAATALGKQRCLNLRPRTQVEWISQRLAETTEARQLLEQAGRPPWGGATDIRSLLQRARAQGTLEPDELLAVRDLIVACQRLSTYFEKGRDTAAMLYELGSRLEQYPELQEQITGCISEEAEVKTDATDQLARLHHRAQTLRDRIQHHLEHLIDEYRHRGLLQEPLIVQRGGRWCLPVLSQFQSRFPGIVHDRSTSGATVFMEPTAIVDLGNQFRDTELAIDEEIRRILRELSAEVAVHGHELDDDLRLIGVLDFIFAKGELAQAQQSTEPQIADQDGYISLNSARHPLLAGEVVPVDLWIGREFATLVITGPNTGGKTVTLKTVGLLTLMAQSGLHLPAEPGTIISVFDAIYADIGDEQSLEQSLSTFSSHMTQIVKIVSRIQAAQQQGRVNTLVLLDEIGAGTDPSEGSALAQAILGRLHEADARTIATTHYNDLKAFAYAQEGMQNASVQFDPRSLQPTYKLLIGYPGSSNAFEIAQHLGLPATLVQHGRQFLSREGRDFARAIQEVEQVQRQLHDERREAEETSRELQQLQRQYAEQLEKLKQERQQARTKGFAEAQRIIADAQDKAHRIIRELQQQQQHTARAEQLRGELKEVREQLQQARAEQEEEIREQPKPLVQYPPLEEVAPGDHVYVAAFDREAVVADIPDEETAMVQIGNIRIEVNISDLRALPETKQVRASSPVRALEVRKEMTVPAEINLRGASVDEALARLEKYLDDAVLASLSQVRVIHGKGTGALREAIHNYLRQHVAVRDFRLAEPAAGGEGATEVVL